MKKGVQSLSKRTGRPCWRPVKNYELLRHTCNQQMCNELYNQQQKQK